MLEIPQTEEFEKIAQRMIWFKPPKEALKDPYTFMAHVMTYGALDDVLAVKKAMGMEAFSEALDKAPSGIMDRKSWVYWHLVTGKSPAPPIPTRKIS